MLVSATRTIWALTLRALFYGALFLAVVVAHMAFTAALRRQGWGGALSLTISGAIVLGSILLLISGADWLREQRALADERARRKQRLPDGPCCVVWREGEGESQEQWELIAPLRTRFPNLPRRLGLEGVAVVDYEVSAEGRAKNIHCVHAWPSDAFYDAARAALVHARFEPKPDIHVRYGESYQMPFVFRIEGAAKLSVRARRERFLRSAWRAAALAVEKLRGALGSAR